MQYTVKVLQTTQETPTVKTIRLEKPKELSFTAGQFLMASTGFKDEKGLQVKRAYSIASAPHENFLELCIKKKPTPSFSSALHELKVGDTLCIEGPFGKFMFKEPQKENTILIAGGAGISPIRSMIKTMMQKELTHKITLFYSFHSPEDYIYKKEFEDLAKQEKNFELIATMSAKENPHPEWMGYRSRATAHLPGYIKKDKIYEVYICGPPQMVTDTVKQLLELGLAEENIHKEMW